MFHQKVITLSFCHWIPSLEMDLIFHFARVLYVIKTQNLKDMFSAYIYCWHRDITRSITLQVGVLYTGKPIKDQRINNEI